MVSLAAVDAIAIAAIAVVAIAAADAIASAAIAIAATLDAVAIAAIVVVANAAIAIVADATVDAVASAANAATLAIVLAGVGGPLALPRAGCKEADPPLLLSFLFCGFFILFGFFGTIMSP